jgi:hypothetical protein
MKRYLKFALCALLLTANAHAATWFSCDGNTFCGSGTASWGYGEVGLAAAPTYSGNAPPQTSNVWRWTFYPGDPMGNGIATLWPAATGVGGSEMWVQWYWMYSPGFQYHDADNKQFYFDPSNTLGMTITPYYHLHMTPQGPNMAIYVGSDTGYIEPTGTWHKYKARYVVNSGNQFNGIWQAWVDDVQIANRTDVYYADGSTTISNPHFAVIWGGMAGTISSTQYMYIAGVYIGSTDPGGSVVVDQVPPYTDTYSPAEGSTGNPKTNRVISFHVKDGGSVVTNVLRSSIVAQVSVNGGAYSSYSYGAG